VKEFPFVPQAVSPRLGLLMLDLQGGVSVHYGTLYSSYLLPITYYPRTAFSFVRVFGRMYLSVFLSRLFREDRK
jgi:hypothetical protein